MPRAKSSGTDDTRDPTVCEVCGTRVARKGDIPRHMQTHLSKEEREQISYACPYPACPYTSLQKGNTETHIRTHTKEKVYHCADCDFKTVDPGSLTRHKKRRHEYVPKPRKPRTPGNRPPTTTAQPASTSQATPLARDIILETPTTYSQLQSVDTTPSEISSPSLSPTLSQSSLAANDTGYESDATQLTSSSAFSIGTQLSTAPWPPVGTTPLIFADTVDYYQAPARPSRRRIAVADLLLDDDQIAHQH